MDEEGQTRQVALSDIVLWHVSVPASDTVRVVSGETVGLRHQRQPLQN